MWIYEQKTGKLFQDSKYIATGYAGCDAGKNNPAMQDKHNIGPLPVGCYDISYEGDTAKHGPYVLALTPHKTNIMFGRGDFRIHGDSIKKPGKASDGCMIFPLAIRQQVNTSHDKLLKVI